MSLIPKTYEAAKDRADRYAEKRRVKLLKSQKSGVKQVKSLKSASKPQNRGFVHLGTQPQSQRERPQSPTRPLLRRGKSLSRRGKKVKLWEGIRSQLKRRFTAAGILTCELKYPGCWFDNGLGFAHSKKRRHIQGEEIREVALLCNHCHGVAERLPEAKMAVLVRKIIAQRNVRM